MRGAVRLLALTAFATLATASQAATLAELWERIATTEPSLLAGLAQARATAERVNQAKAEFYPRVALTANKTRNWRRYETLGEEPVTTRDRYNSDGFQLTATQPLWKPVIEHGHKQALANKEQSYFQFETTRQDLLLRLITAWAEDLDGRDAIRAAQAVEEAAAVHAKAHEQGFGLGLFSKDQRDESQAKYQQAIADRYTAESDWFAKHGQLEQLVGPLAPTNQDYLTLDLNKLPFSAVSYVTITEQLDTLNPAIRAAQFAWLAAQAEVKKQEAEYQPVVELVASTGRNNQPDTGPTPSQAGFRSRVSSIAIQLNWPLYSGGSTTSKVRESRHMVEKARQDMEAARRNAHNQASQGWAQLRSAQAKLEAARQRVVAAKTFEQAAIEGRKNNVKSFYDEVYARQLLESGLREARRAYYDNVIGFSKLKAALGELDEDTLLEIQQKPKNPQVSDPVPRIVFPNVDARGG